MCFWHLKYLIMDKKAVHTKWFNADDVVNLEVKCMPGDSQVAAKWVKYLSTYLSM